LALQFLHFFDARVDVSFGKDSTSFALPVLEDLGYWLVDFSAVMFVVDGALAYFAGQHVVFVCRFI
jgi:hypothetical protein